MILLRLIFTPRFKRPDQYQDQASNKSYISVVLVPRLLYGEPLDVLFPLESYSCNGYTIMQLYTNKILFQVSETENLRKNLAVERMIIEGCDILLDVNQVFVRQGRLFGCFTLFAFVCLHLFPLFFLISHLISSSQSFQSIWHSSLLSHLAGHFVLTLWMPQGSVHDRLLSTVSLSRSFRPISLSLEFW